MWNMRRMAIVIVLSSMLLASCGYHLSGTGLVLPAGTSSIAIPAFINNTNEPYLDVDVTKAVVDEFVADGRLHVEDVETSDVVLRGTVTRYVATPMSYTPSSYVQQYRVGIVVGAVLEDQRSKKILWQEQGIEGVFIAEYPVSYSGAGQADITLTKVAKDNAITKAAQDIASTLRSRVLEGF
jgi:outer membrane lipopolysaccharide assembly protein LptE/RlpB